MGNDIIRNQGDNNLAQHECGAFMGKTIDRFEEHTKEGEK